MDDMPSWSSERACVNMRMALAPHTASLVQLAATFLASREHVLSRLPPI